MYYSILTILILFYFHALLQEISTGQNISEAAPARGEYDLLLKAKNPSGKDTRKLRIISGDKLALTPPVGWNDWYAHYDRITALDGQGSR